jgi:hypothetical protein
VTVSPSLQEAVYVRSEAACTPQPREMRYPAAVDDLMGRLELIAPPYAGLASVDLSHVLRRVHAAAGPAEDRNGDGGRKTLFTFRPAQWPEPHLQPAGSWSKRRRFFAGGNVGLTAQPAT